MEREPGQAAAAAAADERAALAQELHDTLGQRLWTLGLLVDRLVAEAPPAYESGLVELGDQVRELRSDLRGRLHRLHRSVLAGRPLVVALTALSRELAARGSVLLLDLPASTPPLDPRVEDQLWCVALEAIINAEQHGRPLPIRVTWRVDRWGTARLRVVNVARTQAGVGSVGDRAGDGIGVRSMHARVAGIGGELEAGLRRDGTWSVAAAVPRAVAPEGLDRLGEQDERPVRPVRPRLRAPGTASGFPASVASGG